MNTPLADAVHSFFSLGISLRDRLEAGESVQADGEKQDMERLLSALDASSADDANGLIGFDFAQQDTLEDRQRLTQVTVRYALTCWMDEWLEQFSPQGQCWRQRSLEATLFGTDEGGAKFWEEARYAETRGDLDALEVMHLCVMLGFRGDRRNKLDQVGPWVTRIRARLAQGHKPWTMPASLDSMPCEQRRASGAPVRRLTYSLLLAVALVTPLALTLWWRLQ